MRAICILLLLAATAGCGDDSTSAAADMAAGGGGGSGGTDLAVTGDLICANTAFDGFPASPTTTQYFACPCGCTIDPMTENGVSGLWGSQHSSRSSWAPTAGVGLGAALDWDGTNTPEYDSLYSVGPLEQFYLDGDFDISIDYDLVSTPPGEAHLTLGVRDPGTVQGTQIFQVERQQLADGSNAYSTMLGGVPAVTVPTTATHGTLRITRSAYTYKTYGDATQVSTFIAQKAGRVAVTITATLNGCTLSDGGAQCAYQPRFSNLRLASGTLVNLPN